MGLQTLITDLCRDDSINKKDKFKLLTEWREKIIDNNSGRLMDKFDMEAHLLNLEMLDNAIRIVS